MIDNEIMIVSVSNILWYVGSMISSFLCANAIFLVAVQVIIGKCLRTPVNTHGTLHTRPTYVHTYTRTYTPHIHYVSRY